MIGKSTTKKILRVASTGFASLLVWYYSGPLLGELARVGYTQYYTFRYGEPYGWDYLYNFFPTRGHVAGLAYQYGNTVAGIVSYPIFVKIQNLVLGEAEPEATVDNALAERPKPVVFYKMAKHNRSEDDVLENTAVLKSSLGA